MTTTKGTCWGTSHFKDFEAAMRYYRDYERGTTADLRASVQYKLDRGEIHLGPPTIKPGEKLALIDNGTRYEIREET